MAVQNAPSGSVPAAEIPAVPTSVNFGLSVACTLIYFLLFALVYVQLILILCYKHKRFSFQTAFLFLCLIYSLLRTTLFSFYLSDGSGSSSASNGRAITTAAANSLPLPFFWLLFCLPVCLQFVTLCLLVLYYFSRVVTDSKARYEPSNFRYHHHRRISSTSADSPESVIRFRRIVRLMVCTAVFTFTVTNITCAVIVRRQQDNGGTEGIRLYDVVVARVLINESLFLVCGLSLAVCLFRLNRITSSAKVILETKGTTATCVVVVILYFSRAVYNLVVLFFLPGMPSFNFGWINVSDQADLKGLAYITFGIVLFVWEFLPTFIVVVIFRVKRPFAPLVTPDLTGHSGISRAHFFDNPRRYDSDEELFKSATSVGRTVEYCVARTNVRNPSPFGSFNPSSGAGVFRHDSYCGHSSVDTSSASTAGGPSSAGAAGPDNLPQPSTSMGHQHQQPLFVHARIAGPSSTPGRFNPRDVSRNVAFS